MDDVVPDVTVPVTMPDKSVYEYASLAREIAMDLRTLSDILNDHNLTVEHYENLKKNSIFTNLLESMRKEWTSVLNTPDRVAIEAAFTFEQVIPTIFARTQNPDEPLNQVVEAAKLLARAGGIGEGKGEQKGSAEKFAITINLGADNQIKLAGGTPLQPSKLLELSEPVE